MHAFDILTCNPDYTESLDSFLALFCSAFTRGAAPGQTPEWEKWKLEEKKNVN